jgi:heterodisulfide reductase subunit A
MYKSTQEIGVRFIRGRPSEITRNPLNGELKVIVEDTLTMTPLQLNADMVVLSAAMVPPEGIGPLGSKLKVLRSKEGFLKEFHIKMNPTLSSKGGIFLAGTIQGPKDISESVAHAGSAAALAAAPLVRGYIEKEMLVPSIDYDLCVNCGICKTICAPAAIDIDENGRPTVNEIACRSCGMCMPSCPTAAIQLINFTDEQLYDEIIAVSGGGAVCE